VSTPTWIEIRATLPREPEDWSVYADAFDAHGCPGTQIVGLAMTGYLADLPAATSVSASLKEALENLGADVELGVIEEADWSELWKIHFKTRRVGERFVIRPSWEVYEPAPNDLVIELDPGQAFGTGDHPTTRLCLQELEKVEGSGVTVADVGCGSGVLAIGAAKMGFQVVMASDLDPLSVEITKENAARNATDFPTAVAPGFDAVEGQVDVALSNIISATLIRLAPNAAHHVAPGGRWIVSGIIQANWPDVRTAAESVGFSLLSESTEDDWIGATFLR
jgi:ribosomal protein L11 methyltransferase